MLIYREINIVFIGVFDLAVGIKLRDNESIDRALRRFKRSVNRSRILRIYRSGQAFTKPSEEKRVEKQKAVRNARKRRYDNM
jgi:small subunit ribosomal protein S21